MNQDIQTARIVVTGGCGFIGSHLVEKLHDMGFHVTVVDDKRHGNFCWKLPRVNYVSMDVANCKLTELMARPIAIFHLANITRDTSPFVNPRDVINSNTLTTTAVCDWASYWETYLFFATDSEEKFLDKESLYYWSKKNSESIIDYYDKLHAPYFHYVNMVLYNVYGPREPDYGDFSPLIKKFKDNYLAGLPLRVYGSGNKKRDFTHVDDVVQGMLQLLVSDGLPREVHLGKGSPKSVMAIATAFDTTVLHEFDAPGDPDIVECTTPYIECPNDVIKYINSWLKENPIDN